MGKHQAGTSTLRGLHFPGCGCKSFCLLGNSHRVGSGRLQQRSGWQYQCSGGRLQPVHVDDGQLWPDPDAAHPAVRLVVNVSLGDTSEENGAIELWPGTHEDLRNLSGHDIRVSEEALVARRQIVPPILGSTKKGVILIRDMRLWHRGMPNANDAARFMIGMVHNVAWIRRRSRCQPDRRFASMFEGCAIENKMPFVDDPGDAYLRRDEPYAYDGPN